VLWRPIETSLTRAEAFPLLWLLQAAIYAIVFWPSAAVRLGRGCATNPTPHVLGILAVGYRAGITAAQLGWRFRGLGRFWDVVFWPRCQGRANDVGNFRRFSRWSSEASFPK